MNAIASESTPEVSQESEAASEETYELDFSAQPYVPDSASKYLKHEEEELDFTPQAVEKKSSVEPTSRDSLHEVDLPSESELENSIHFQNPDAQSIPVFERPP